MGRDLKYIELTERRNFLQARLEKIESGLLAGYGSYSSITEHDQLNQKIYELNLEINRRLAKLRNRKTFWKLFFRK